MILDGSRETNSYAAEPATTKRGSYKKRAA